MSRVLITLAEDVDATTKSHFAVIYSVDEGDCYHFADALQALDHDVFFMNWNDFNAGRITRLFHSNQKRFVDPLPLHGFDLAFIYKMEGFYERLSEFLGFLKKIENAIPVVVNHPDTIRHNIGKHYLFDLMRAGINVIPTFPIDDGVRDLLNSGRDMIIKPVYGERGDGIFRARCVADMEAVAENHGHYLAQEFMPCIREGERSLVYLGFDFQHAVLKKPPANSVHEFRCNESLGGSVAVYAPSPDEFGFADQILRTYASLGYPVHFSRVDLLRTDNGPALVEAELLNPSMYANYCHCGREFGHAVADYFHRLLKTALH